MNNSQKKEETDPVEEEILIDDLFDNPQFRQLIKDIIDEILTELAQHIEEKTKLFD